MRPFFNPRIRCVAELIHPLNRMQINLTILMSSGEVDKLDISKKGYETLSKDRYHDRFLLSLIFLTLYTPPAASSSDSPPSIGVAGGAPWAKVLNGIISANTVIVIVISINVFFIVLLLIFYR